MKKLRVSIVIPSYNQEQYVEEAIVSALNQTMKCEVIFVDDGSPDGSIRIARKYDTRMKIISQTNRGLASARNTGIMNATGDYILPLDADDILTSECAETLFKLATQTGADVVAPSFHTFGLAAQNVVLMPNPTLNDFRLANRIGYFSLIKKSVLLSVGGYSPKMVHGYEDYHLWFNLLTKGKRIVTTPEILAMYRTKEDSMWHDAKNNHHDELMAQIYKDFPEVRV